MDLVFSLLTFYGVCVTMCSRKRKRKNRKKNKEKILQ